MAAAAHSLFGVKVVQAKSVVAVLPALLEHKDKGVRAEAQQVATELYRYKGEAARESLKKIPEARVSEDTKCTCTLWR